MIDGYADTNVRRRVLIYWIAGLGLVPGFATACSAAWTGHPQLHTLMEVVPTLLAAVVGAVALEATAAIPWSGAASSWFLSILLFCIFVPLLRAFDPKTFFHRLEALPACSSICFRLSGKRRMVAAW
jgi:hypothetical protein